MTLILICADAVLEATCAALMISANAYCSGHSGLPELYKFNYCKEILFVNNKY